MKITTLMLAVFLLCTVMVAQQNPQAAGVRQMEELRASAEKRLSDYDLLIASRSDLTLQLQEAVGINDKVLIERAVNDVADNRTALMGAAVQVDDSRKKLMEEAGQELLAKQISKTMYVYQLDFSRQVDQLLKEAPSGQLLGLLIDAHKKAETSYVYSDFIQEKKPAGAEEAAANTAPQTEKSQR